LVFCESFSSSYQPSRWLASRSRVAIQGLAGGLPVIERPGATLRLIAGSAFGATTEVATASELFYVEADLAAGASLALDSALGERAAYIVSGTVRIEDAGYEAGRLLVFRAGVDVTLSAGAATKLMLLGGAPLGGERHIWWNFVSSSRERIETAKRDWQAGRFPVVPGDDGFMPLPG